MTFFPPEVVLGVVKELIVTIKLENGVTFVVLSYIPFLKVNQAYIVIGASNFCFKQMLRTADLGQVRGNIYCLELCTKLMLIS